MDGQSSYEWYADGDADLYDAYVETYKLYVDDYYLHNMSVKYSADDWSITGGVRNLEDKAPPSISTGVINTVANAPLYSGYDYFGRTFFVNFTKEF